MSAEPKYETPYPVKRQSGDIIWDWGKKEWVPYKGPVSPPKPGTGHAAPPAVLPPAGMPGADVNPGASNAPGGTADAGLSSGDRGPAPGGTSSPGPSFNQRRRVSPPPLVSAGLLQDPNNPSAWRSDR